MDIRDLPAAQLYEMNQRHFEETLRAEYENGSASFVAQIDDLIRQGFTSIIRTRGDGDCFYRSLAFAFIDQLIRAEDPELAVATALGYWKTPTFDEIVYDLPYGVFTDLIKRIVSQSSDRLTPTGLLEAFQDPEGTQTPQYIVMYLRLLTSAQIRTAPDEFEAFIMHPETGMEMAITEFCELFVDPMGKEADHVQIAALSRALRVRIQIAYLDGRSSDGKVEFVEFNHEPDSSGQSLLLLYRPGHYDIIDKNVV
ncbi:peptidase C65 Otubain-domain-containing protein [Pisolithus sp. B1]|nr:peptidase C65 Otubain-domain-containing protein [Pisolithus sp. B1]